MLPYLLSFNSLITLHLVVYSKQEWEQSGSSALFLLCRGTTCAQKQRIKDFNLSRPETLYMCGLLSL